VKRCKTYHRHSVPPRAPDPPKLPLLNPNGGRCTIRLAGEMVPVVVHPLDAPKELASTAAAEPAAFLLVAVSGLTGLVAGSGGARKQHDVRCDVMLVCVVS
jgi:hypothetical protein